MPGPRPGPRAATGGRHVTARDNAPRGAARVKAARPRQGLRPTRECQRRTATASKATTSNGTKRRTRVPGDRSLIHLRTRDEGAARAPAEGLPGKGRPMERPQEGRQMKRWKFGVEQSAKEERAEIGEARMAGRERQYMEGQRWQRMREDELERRRQRRDERRAASSSSTRRGGERPSGGSDEVLPLGRSGTEDSTRGCEHGAR